jgi:flagellar biosynthetic protein FlhB
MSDQDDEADKSHEPTQHKLDEARKKGEVARSADMTTAASYAGFLLAGLVAGSSSIQTVSEALMVLVGQPSRLAPVVFDGPATPLMGGLIGTIALALLAWALVPAGMALLSVVAQQSFVVAPSKVKPKASRLDPIQNAKQKYGPSGLFEFAKSFVKLLGYSVVLGLYLTYRMPEMVGTLHAEPKGVGILLTRMIVEFMSVVLVIALVIGGIDLVFQHHDHRRRNRMSHREVKEEHKHNEGDPHMKQERRQRATEVASNKMMADVPDADVVIMNPTHYAVALQWSRAPGAAPICVAKGKDHLAIAIRDLALENGVPVRRDPPTARAIHAMTELGEEIDTSHYRAVAAAIRFADAMRRKAKAYGQ